MAADYDIGARDQISRMDRRLRDLETRLDVAEREARNALTDLHRLEDRVRELEISR
jgi:chromosome segregation ATPase